MKKIIAILILSVNMLNVFAQKIIKTDTSSTSLLRVNPESAIGANASDIFDSIKYIPLETNKESTFGDINQLEVVEKYFIILDHNTNSIYIFTKEGKFHAKIKGGSQIPIYSFSVNRLKSLIAFSSDNFTSTSYCNFDGIVVKKVKNIDFSQKALFNLNFFYLGSDEIVSYDQYRDFDKNSKYYMPFSRSLLRFTSAKGDVNAMGMIYSDSESKIDVLNTGDLRQLTRSGKDDQLFFSKPYEYGVYVVSSNTIKQSFQIILPSKFSLPNDFISNRKYDTKRAEFVQRNSKVIYGFSNIYRISDNLIFKTNSFATSKLNNLIYGLHTGTLIAFKHIMPDPKSYFLPLYDDKSGNFENVGLAFCDGVNLYSSISSLSMFKSKEENKKLNTNYSSDLQAYFSKESNKSNPVILELKLKSNL